MPELQSKSCDAIDLQYKCLGLDKLLLSPPVDNARNVIDFGLYFMTYQVSTTASLVDMWKLTVALGGFDPVIFAVVSRSKAASFG